MSDKRSFSFEAMMVPMIQQSINSIPGLRNIHWLCQTFSVIWIFGAYLGLFCAVASVAFLPFKAAALTEGDTYVFLICMILAVGAACFFILARIFYQFLRYRKTIVIDVAVALLSLLVVLSLLVWFYSDGLKPFAN